jgi:hypothetical protein
VDAGILLALLDGVLEERAVNDRESGFTKSQIRFWSICAVLILGGGGAVVGAEALPWPIAQLVIKELGLGLFIAGIVAALVDPYFRRELSRDAFVASFRYVLPPEFKDEITKIMRFEFIAEKQLWTVKIERLNDDIVFVTTSFAKTFRNKTSSKKSVAGLYVVPDLKFKEGPTTLLECGIEYEEKKEEFNNKTEDNEHSIGATTEKIDILPNKTARTYGKATQYRRTSDLVFETFGMPAVEPEIEVIIDPGLNYHVEFGPYGDVEKSRYGNRHRLSGVYFPGQHMFVRWWPKRAATKSPV